MPTRPQIFGGSSPKLQPDEIAGLELWTRSDLGVSTSGSSVTNWADQSGNGRDLAPGVAPTLVAGVVNGHPVIRFNGSSQYLLRAGFTINQPYHIFCVVQARRHTAGNRLIHLRTVNNFPSIHQTSPSPNVSQVDGAPYNSVAMTVNNWFLLNSLWAGASSYQALNDAARVAGAGPSTQINGLILCARENATQTGQFDIAEFIVYSRDIEQELSGLMIYFRERYALW